MTATTDETPMNGPTNEQIERAAKALREHDMKGRITRPWGDLPNYDAKKWRTKASIALWAALYGKSNAEDK